MVQDSIDPLVLGHRVRYYRRRAGLTLDELGEAVGKPAPYLSMLENGKREPRLGLINALAEALDVGAGDLLLPDPPTKRSRLEIGIVRAQGDPVYRDLELPALKPNAKLPDIALEHILSLYQELKGRAQATMATREEARIANSELRAEMRARGNYFAEIEEIAAEAVAGAGYSGGGFTEGTIQAMCCKRWGISLSTIRSRRTSPSSCGSGSRPTTSPGQP